MTFSLTCRRTFLKPFQGFRADPICFQGGHGRADIGVVIPLPATDTVLFGTRANFFGRVSGRSSSKRMIAKAELNRSLALSAFPGSATLD